MNQTLLYRSLRNALLVHFPVRSLPSRHCEAVMCAEQPEEVTPPVGPFTLRIPFTATANGGGAILQFGTDADNFIFPALGTVGDFNVPEAAPGILLITVNFSAASFVFQRRQFNTGILRITGGMMDTTMRILTPEGAVIAAGMIGDVSISGSVPANTPFVLEIDNMELVP